MILDIYLSDFIPVQLSFFRQETDNINLVNLVFFTLSDIQCNKFRLGRFRNAVGKREHFWFSLDIGRQVLFGMEQDIGIPFCFPSGGSSIPVDVAVFLNGQMIRS